MGLSDWVGEVVDWFSTISSQVSIQHNIKIRERKKRQRFSLKGFFFWLFELPALLVQLLDKLFEV